MKTIKVIDLLVKMSNDENYRPKIKRKGKIWTYNNILRTYENEFNDRFGLFNHYCIDMILNDEVEIIEEDKKIEKVHECFTSTDNKEIQFVIDNINQLGKVVNKIIDYINKNEENK